MGEPTPPDIEQVLEQARIVLMRMRRDEWLGEVAVVVGGNQLQVEERLRRRQKPVKVECRGASVVEIVE